MEDWLVPSALNLDLGLKRDAIYYQPTPGREDCRTAMCRYAERILELDDGRLDPDGMVVGAGCNAVLENLCFCLAEAGDAVLIPTPYYAAFEFDLTARAGAVVVPVTTQRYRPQREQLNDDDISSDATVDPSIYYPTTEALDAAYERSLASGHVPKILLLSHPHNPLGICYPKSVVKECIDFCEKKRIHLVSDEIYAGSVYKKDQAGFESVLKLADNGGTGLGPYVHWVYALSKDFALSGLRVGAAYSENEAIRFPMQKLNDMCQISSATQRWTTLSLTRYHDGGKDLLWTDAFREENHRRIRDRSAAITSCLQECGIKYLEPTSGLFVWIDLSRYLPDASGVLSPGDQERQLYLELVNEYGLLLTPGWSMRNELPGFFRCVFTAASDDEFALSLTRFRKFAAARNYG